jgi:hypothetical protein
VNSVRQPNVKEVDVTRVSPAELSEQLSDILARVVEHGERIVVERDGVEVAVIQPPTVRPAPTLHQFSAMLAGLEWPDHEFFSDLEAIHAELNTPVEPPEWPS